MCSVDAAQVRTFASPLTTPLAAFSPLACFVFVLCWSSRPIDGALFALCITYLGASVGVLGDRSDVSVDTILRYLEKQPDVLVCVSFGRFISPL
jgi:hypothetical protein